MAPVKRTEKQREIMRHIIDAARAGAFINTKELMGLLSYPVSYSAIRVSIQFLEKGGMLKREVVGPHGRTVLVPTEEGFRWF